ncbi:MAG: ABC transporter substrate-binding protein [Bacilli bacterium]|nr:ABC transporter substrate-binding protein [Bacilli bacterium]
MKKRIFIYLLCGVSIFLIGAATLFDFNKNKSDVEVRKKITLAEVAHTPFYAPMYVAIEKGYFIDYGIDIDLILTSGADKVTAALLSHDADIGLCGSEATIYVYNGGEKDYLKTFSQLTQKDGTFIVSREKINNFTLNDLKGKNIIGGRAAGMPEMTLEYALKQNGIDPREDVNIDTSIAFAAMSGAFIGGEGDFVTLFEPTASMVEKQGYGYVVASVGELGGVVPYTSFSARNSFIKNNDKLINNFDKAIQKGLDFVHNTKSKDIAKVIAKQFPDSSTSELADAIERYKNNDTWPEATTFTEESFNHLQDIMIDYGELNSKVRYNDLFYKIERE